MTTIRLFRLVARAVLPLCLCFAPVLPSKVAAQDEEPVTIGTRTYLRSEILDEERTLLVHLPAEYPLSSDRYPVLYLLDGEGHFQHVTGIVDFLAAQQRIPPMIVVGIANTDRTRDLTPPTATPRQSMPRPFAVDSLTIEFPTAGGADTFLRFLTEELAPWVEGRYRTADFRVLVGHSFGGLFAVHALLTRPQSFQAIVAISPSLWWNDDEIPNTAAETLASGLPPGSRFLYMTVGDREGTMVEPLRRFTEALETVRPTGLRWWYRVMPGETHGSVPHRTVYDGLEAIFAEYAVPDVLAVAGDLGHLEDHFAAASRTYGYDIPLPEVLVNRWGYLQLQLERPEKAVQLFQRNAELHPRSANVYDSLADALEAANRPEEALPNREKAVELATAGHDPRAAGFRTKLEALRERLEASDRLQP